MKKIIFYVTLSLFSVSHAQNVFRDNFNSYTIDSQLNGQGNWSNNTTLGGLGTCTPANCNNAEILDLPLGYANWGISTKSVELKANADGCGTLFTPILTGTFFAGFLINLSDASNSATDFFRILNGSSASSAAKIYTEKVSATHFKVGVSKSSGTIVYSNTTHPFNSTVLVLLKYDILSGASDDVIQLYVNPVMVNGIPPVANAITNSGTDEANNINGVVIRQNAASGLPTGKISLVSVSKNWNGLHFITLENNGFNKDSFIVNSSQIKSGLLSITYNMSYNNVTLTIYNIRGEIMQEKQIALNEQINQIDINPITTNAVYIAVITSEDNSKFTQKIIVE